MFVNAFTKSKEQVSLYNRFPEAYESLLIDKTIRARSYGKRMHNCTESLSSLPPVDWTHNADMHPRKCWSTILWIESP